MENMIGGLAEQLTKSISRATILKLAHEAIGQAKAHGFALIVLGMVFGATWFIAMWSTRHEVRRREFAVWLGVTYAFALVAFWLGILMTWYPLVYVNIGALAK